MTNIKRQSPWVGPGCPEAAGRVKAVIIIARAEDVTQETASILKVAGIQTPSVPGEVEANLVHRIALVEEAAGQGAQLAS